MSVKDVKKILIDKIMDKRGNLSFFEQNNQIPFLIKRVYWIYDVPGGEYRGGHAFKSQYEVIVALSGSFDVLINDGKNEKRFFLNRSYEGLLIPNMLWRQLENFSTNSLCLIVANTEFCENDYIRSYDEFKELKLK